MSGVMICRTNVVKCIDDRNRPLYGGTGRREVNARDVSLGEMRDGLWGQSIDSETGNTWQQRFIPRYPNRTAFFKKTTHLSALSSTSCTHEGPLRPTGRRNRGTRPSKEAHRLCQALE